MGFCVKDLEVDLYKYFEHTFVFRYIDYHVAAEYVDPRQFRLHVQLLNSGVDGSTDHLQILAVHLGDAQIVDVGPFSGSATSVLVETDYDIVPDTTRPFGLRPLHQEGWWNYKPNIRKIPRRRFNALFNTDVVVLPKSMFAIGMTDWGAVYMYHEDEEESRLLDIAGGVPIVDSVEWQNIREPVMHMLRVGAGMGVDSPYLMGYFIVSSSDGYLERTYWSGSRTVERPIGEFECSGATFPPADLGEHEFPVFHSAKTIFTQSGHVGLAHCVNIPDRHYFFHNLHNSFRSFHMGLPWQMKESKVVYAGQARDNKYNFLSAKMRKLGVAPRDYFKSVYAVENRDIIECDGTWLDRNEMIHYRYILDLDGTASTWDATAWKLNSGSVIFKPKSMWQQWFYDKYQAGVHFIEIADDFSDLRAKFEWCEAHPIECCAMVARCKALFQEVYRYGNVVEYTKKILARDVFHLGKTEPSIYDHIDHVFYINLDRRTDRRAHIEKTLREYGLDRFERFSAIPHDFGIVGCTQSHQAVYKLAKERGYKNVLIFEDDFEFLVSPEEFRRTIADVFSWRPLDGDVYMFSFNLTQMEEMEEDSPLVRILEASTASCYLVQSHYYDKLIDLYEVAIPLLETTREHWKYANDQCWKTLQIEDRWYGTKTRIGKQMDGYSDNSCEYTKNLF